jgi:hypothetical protein
MDGAAENRGFAVDPAWPLLWLLGAHMNPNLLRLESCMRHKIPQRIQSKLLFGQFFFQIAV